MPSPIQSSTTVSSVPTNRPPLDHQGPAQNQTRALCTDFRTDLRSDLGGPAAPSSRQEAESNSSDNEEGRFVGELNPESIFLATSSPKTISSSGDDNIGIWIPRRALYGSHGSRNNSASTPALTGGPLLSNILIPYMQRQCLSIVPVPADFSALYRIYRREVHPLFPAIDIKAFNSQSPDAPSAIILKQGICLAASTSLRAQQHLKIPSRHLEQSVDGGHIGTFRERISTAIRMAVDMGFVKDHMVITQAFALLALFSQFSRHAQLSAEVTARTISHAQTMGLHLEAPQEKDSGEYLGRLFCCVWALDKLNAAFHGRPTMMHKHDFGRDLSKHIAAQEGCFRLFLNVVLRLDEVIGLYRPGLSPPSSAPESLPSFEQLIYECEALRVVPQQLATVETLYHAVSMLACRTRTVSQTNSPSNARETMSAASVLSVVGNEYKDQLSSLPVVAYSLSLALRVFYRDLRFSSKSPFSRNRTRKQLVHTCELLRDFGESFPTVLKMVALAEQTLQEMDKVYSHLMQQHQQQRSRSNSEPVEHADAVTKSSNAVSSQSPITHFQPYMISPDSDGQSFPTDTMGYIPDLDVFDYFDADFHLDAVDATLMDNMNMTFNSILDNTSISQSVPDQWFI